MFHLISITGGMLLFKFVGASLSLSFCEESPVHTPNDSGPGLQDRRFRWLGFPPCSVSKGIGPPFLSRSQNEITRSFWAPGAQLRSRMG